MTTKKKPRPPAQVTLPDFPIRTQRLVLRPLVAADAQAMHRLVNDWEVVRMLSRLPFPYPRALMDDWIASTAAQMAEGRAYHLAITGEELGREMLIGCVGLRLDAEPNVAQLGYWVGRRYWGHGVATEVATRMASWAYTRRRAARLRNARKPHRPAMTQRTGKRGGRACPYLR